MPALPPVVSPSQQRDLVAFICSGYALADRPVVAVDESGGLRADPEPIDIESLITWIYEPGSFTPVAKLVGSERYSIISNYLSTPVQAFNDAGEKVWQRELDIYGAVREGSNDFVPFTYPGQYYDQETGLCYNRFRYYDPANGLYISKDPIGLDSGEANFYSYVNDTNTQVDKFGLLSTDPGVYEVFHESFLPEDMWKMSDRKHFQEANRKLYNSMKNDPKLKNALESKYPGIYNHVSPGQRGAFKGTAFKGTTWHHHPEVAGLLQLVDRADHNTRFPDYHPEGYGGRNKWGGGSAYR